MTVTKKTTTSKKSGILGFLSRFRREERGVTAIEFGFVITPFLLIVLGTIEVALLHLTRSSISNAANAAYRDVYTGSLFVDANGDLQDPSDPAVAATLGPILKERFCARLAMVNTEKCELSSDDAGGSTFIMIDPVTNLNSLPTPGDPLQDRFNFGNGSATMMMQIVHKWDFYIPMAEKAIRRAPNLADPDADVLLIENVLFVNEPFN